MKYMLLMQFSEQTADFPSIGTWAPEEIQAHIAFMKDANKKIADAGSSLTHKGWPCRNRQGSCVRGRGSATDHRRSLP